MTDSGPQIADLLVMYEEGHAVIVAALVGITEEELDTPEAPGEWTPRQIVHHLGDSEMISGANVRKVLAHDNPLISGYDHEVFAETLWRGAPIDDSLDLFRAARVSTLPLLQGCSEADFSRTWVTPEGDTYTLYEWLTWYGPHAHSHAEQITRARATAASS